MIEIKGATPTYERSIRAILNSIVPWFLGAARIKWVEISNEPDVREMIALYDHETRRLRIKDNAGQLLQKAIYHELWHAIDDDGGINPHFFSGRDDWLKIHKDTAYFDIPKYRDEPLEYFADMGAKYFLIGRERLSVTNPNEVAYIEQIVLPALKSAFGG